VTKLINTFFTSCPTYAFWTELLLRGIAYNSSTKGKCTNTNDSKTTESTENCQTEKKNTEVENDKKVSFVSFDSVTNVG